MTPTRRLMAVHAHPDDESSKGAATTAKYAASGYGVMVVSCTGGERGDILNPSFPLQVQSLDQMKHIRRAEMAQAAKALGVEHLWLGYVDSGLPEGDPLPPLPEGSFAASDIAEQIGALVAAIRRYRPHVLTTYDPLGGYPHPDHVRSHQVAVGAFLASGRADLYPQAGQPWQVAKLYYNHDFSIARSTALHEALIRDGYESPFGHWIERREQWDIIERPVTTRIDVADYRDQRDAALRAHASQIDPDGFFFAVPRSIENAVWPWEEYELAASTVTTHVPETDLFAGIDEGFTDEQIAASLSEITTIAGYEDESPEQILRGLFGEAPQGSSQQQ